MCAPPLPTLLPRSARQAGSAGSGGRALPVDCISIMVCRPPPAFAAGFCATRWGAFGRRCVFCTPSLGLASVGRAPPRPPRPALPPRPPRPPRPVATALPLPFGGISVMIVRGGGASTGQREPFNLSISIEGQRVSAVRVSLEIRPSRGWFGVRPFSAHLVGPGCGVLPRRVGSQLQAGAWFITEVRSLQDLRQQEDR